MGSLVYARGCEARHEKIAAMISLERMAFFSDVEDSQRYPFRLSLFYPSRGDFLGFVGNLASTALVNESVRVLADRRARGHGHRHRTIPRPELPLGLRHAREARLHALRQRGRRSGCRHPPPLADLTTRGWPE
jgi:hypothetical protein